MWPRSSHLLRCHFLPCPCSKECLPSFYPLAALGASTFFHALHRVGAELWAASKLFPRFDTPDEHLLRTAAGSSVSAVAETGPLKPDWIFDTGRHHRHQFETQLLRVQERRGRATSSRDKDDEIGRKKAGRGQEVGGLVPGWCADGGDRCITGVRSADRAAPPGRDFGGGRVIINSLMC